MRERRSTSSQWLLDLVLKIQGPVSRLQRQALQRLLHHRKHHIHQGIGFPRNANETTRKIGTIPLRKVSQVFQCFHHDRCMGPQLINARNASETTRPTKTLLSCKFTQVFQSRSHKAICQILTGTFLHQDLFYLACYAFQISKLKLSTLKSTHCHGDICGVNTGEYAYWWLAELHH